MTYEELVETLSPREGVEESTMMGSHCLRYRGEFMTMLSTREEALIVKLPAARVDELIENGSGEEFNFTKKKFKEWLLVRDESHFEALGFARAKRSQ